MKKEKRDSQPYLKRDLVIFLMTVVLSLMIVSLIVISLFNKKIGEDDDTQISTAVELDTYQPIFFEDRTKIEINNQTIVLPQGWELENAFIATSVQQQHYTCQSDCNIFEISNDQLSAYFSTPSAVILQKGPATTQIKENIKFLGVDATLITLYVNIVEEDSEASVPIQQYVCSNQVCLSSQEYSLTLEADAMSESFKQLVSSV